MLKNAANKPKRFVAKVCILITGKKWFAVFPDRHIAVHACAVITCNRFGHKCCRFAVSLRHVMNDILIFLQFIGLFGQAVKNKPQLMLARSDLMVVFIHFHAQTLHGRKHFRTDILAVINRVNREIATLYTWSMTSVAHFILRICIP